MANDVTILKDASIMVHTPPKGVTAVDVRRAVLNNPDAMAKLDVIERSVFRATTDIPFEQYSGETLTADLREMMGWVAKDIGLRNTGNEDYEMAIVRIAQILKRYYGNMTLEEIRMAFELAITGELNDYLPKDRNGNPDKDHYQAFTPDYFCKIVNAYKVYRGRVIQKAMAAVPEPVAQQDAADKAYYNNIIHQNTIAAFEYYKTNGEMPQMSEIGIMCTYGDLVDVGLAEPLEITEQEQRLALRRVLYQLEHARLIGDKMRVEEQGVTAPEIIGPATRLARFRALKDTFAVMAQKGINITDYIKVESDGN